MIPPQRASLLLSIVVTIVAASHAFNVSPAFIVRGSSSSTSSTSLSFATGADGESMRVKHVRKAIDGLNSENFYQTLQTIEPFLLNDAGTTAYAKCMHRIKRTARTLKIDLPANYALPAVATTKRREKLSAYIQTKEEARIAAEAKAAEEAAAAEAAAAEAAAKAAAEAEEAARIAAEAEEAAKVAAETAAEVSTEVAVAEEPAAETAPVENAADATLEQSNADEPVTA